MLDDRTRSSGVDPGVIKLRAVAVGGGTGATKIGGSGGRLGAWAAEWWCGADGGSMAETL